MISKLPNVLRIVMPQQARHRPVASLLITVGRFPQILDLLQRLKSGVPSGCLGKTPIFEIIMIDDTALWSKLKSTWEVNSILLILFHRRTIFKVLAFKQSAEK